MSIKTFFHKKTHLPKVTIKEPLPSQIFYPSNVRNVKYGLIYLRREAIVY